MYRALVKFNIATLILAAGVAAPLFAQESPAASPIFGARSSSGTANETASAAAPQGATTSNAAELYSKTMPATMTDPAYRIGADDVLTVNVWHEPEVSRNVPVRPDGKISLPLVGDVQAGGLTPVQLRSELEERFTKYLTNPEVSVIVAEIRSQRVNVLGQVSRPGTYPLIPPMGVLDAIAGAGGLREFAKSKGIYVLRTGPDGQRHRLHYDYRSVLKGKKGSKDLTLQTRDTVVVP